MDLIEKKGETVSFSCLKFHAQNIPECRILHLIFKKFLGGGENPPKTWGPVQIQI